MNKWIVAFCSGGMLTMSAADPAPVWNYNPASPSGPPLWGATVPQNATCGTTVEVGKRQSPINIEPAKAVQAILPELRFRYDRTPLEIENTGHVIEVPYAEGSFLRIGSSLTDQYQLRQFHLHAPSEHTVDGRQFDAELHMVHINVLGEAVAVGVLLTKSRDATAGVLDDIMIRAPLTPGRVPVDGVTLNARGLLPENHRYYTYTGSLTTPPCTESVRWFVLTEPVLVTESMLQLFHSLISRFPGQEGFQNNNRAVTPLNGRPVLVVQ